MFKKIWLIAPAFFFTNTSNHNAIAADDAREQTILTTSIAAEFFTQEPMEACREKMNEALTRVDQDKLPKYQGRFIKIHLKL